MAELCGVQTESVAGGHVHWCGRQDGSEHLGEHVCGPCGASFVVRRVTDLDADTLLQAMDATEARQANPAALRATPADRQAARALWSHNQVGRAISALDRVVADLDEYGMPASGSRGAELLLARLHHARAWLVAADLDADLTPVLQGRTPHRDDPSGPLSQDHATGGPWGTNAWPLAPKTL
jgi:hypothetical protein